MKIGFLYPNPDPQDALANWVATLSRHCKENEVLQATSVAGCEGCDVVLALTQSEKYPPERIDADLLALRAAKVPYGVVHNQDNPAVPTPGDYPSFCWTFASWKKLADRKASLVRMPVLPCRDGPTFGPGTVAGFLNPHVATFGACEPKKQTVQMAQRCKALGVPFTAWVPGVFAEQHQDYCDRVRKLAKQYDNLIIHPWLPKIEDLASSFRDVSHFLFVLPPGKGGHGGSPTSCRYATAFGRPVVVVDDEGTYALDGFTVLQSLADLSVEVLRAAELPNYDWVPDRYVGRLANLVLEHWRR